MDYDQLINGVCQMAQRKRSGYKSCCALIDLLGMTDLILKDIEEAQRRIDALHEGFVDAQDLYPGLEGCRASFFGDTVVVLKELEPEENLEEFYRKFCGYIFCLSNLIKWMEHEFDDPGIRVIVSYGKLIPLTRPNAWHDAHLASVTKEWQVFTGANEAFAKCCKAEEGGSKKGFKKNMFWSEELDNNLDYMGIPFLNLPHHTYRNEAVYEQVYRQIINKQCTEKATLECKTWVS